MIDKREIAVLLRKKLWRFGLSDKLSKMAVDEIVDIIREQLVSGEGVRISKLGVLRVENYTNRSIRNFRTGKNSKVPLLRVVKFLPCVGIRNELNERMPQPTQSSNEHSALNENQQK